MKDFIEWLDQNRFGATLLTIIICFAIITVGSCAAVETYSVNHWKTERDKAYYAKHQ
jgi:Tfp pilus assembly protein PilE